MSAHALDLRPAPSLPRPALALSVAIHVAALLLLPGLARKTEELPALIATLRFPAPVAPTASNPEQMPAPPLKEASPPHRPVRSTAQPPAPTPIVARNEVPVGGETTATPAAAVASPARNDNAPATAAPATAAPAAGPAQDSAALDDYGRALSDLLARQQQYPRVAALRGWEGEVRLRLRVARKGNLVGVQIVHSSGHEVLDQHAVQMVQGTALPSPPESFGDREIQIVVPIHYKLQKST